MKKIVICFVVGFLLFGFSSLALAEEHHAATTNKDTMKGDLIGRQMGDTDDMKMMGMCGMMTGKSVVATTDGGVVVMAGNKLLKYDKNLMLKKETEIKIDMMNMQKMMAQMMEKCPMRGQDDGMIKGMQSSQAKSKCAEEWLKKAINLHELHMEDSTTTTDDSQMELMDQIKEAYKCLTGKNYPMDNRPMNMQ